jgi:hypothetical protein
MDRQEKVKKPINTKTASEVAEILVVYKEEVEIPIWNFASVMNCLPKNQYHMFAIAVKGDKMLISFAETINKKANGEADKGK